MKEVKININDIKKAVYFIANLTQMQGDRPMQGALSSKADYMGGIFDRWINIIPESVIFNKMVLPEVFNGEEVEVITDYYDYNPRFAGIAPDVIGIRYKNRPIPFVKFDNKWCAVPNTPQIEVKTFKKNQFMVSLRNQGYDDKYLVMAETNFRVDYLVPILQQSFFSREVFLDLHMDDKIFIVSNDDGIIAQPHEIELSDTTLGTVKLLVVTTAKEFMNKAVKCGPRESIEYIKFCDEYTGNRVPNESIGKLSDYAELSSNGLNYFNSNWYEKTDSDGITYKNGKKVRTVGFYASDLNQIEIMKINKKNMYVKALDNCYFQNNLLEKNHIYNINFETLDRSSNEGEEYFMSKNDITYLNDSFSKLSSDLKKAIMDN